MGKKTIAILGATGMLGSALYEKLKDKYHLILGVRDPAKVELLEKKFGGTKGHEVIPFDAAALYREFLNKNGHHNEHVESLTAALSRADFIINAIGITIPYALEDSSLTFFINGYLPHFLASHFGSRLIHITTDCVYNGREGFPYHENSKKSPVDVYGLSKSLGEPTTCLTLRTSIIGRELEGFTGLLEWFLSQRGKTIKGFVNHFWNGVTTREFAKLCDKIISDRDSFPETGLFHVFSDTVSKYDMVSAFRDTFHVDCEIVPEYENKLNRTLSTLHPVNARLAVASFPQMVRELAPPTLS